jgi:hypothetical protein
MRGQTDYRSCDVACTGIYDSTCDLAQNGLSDCVTCSKQFVNLDKKYFLRYGKKAYHSPCRDCLVSLGNATILQGTTSVQEQS